MDQDDLVLTILTENTWVFTIGDRIDRLGFHSDGSISGVRLWDIEHKWDFRNNVLSIFSSSGATYLRLRWTGEKFEGSTNIRGHIVLCTLKNSGQLRQPTHYRERARDRILSESRMGASKALYTSYI